MIQKVFKKPYRYFFVLIFVTYVILNVILSQFYITLQYIPKYLETLKWEELVISGILSLIIGILIALNTMLIYLKWKERRDMKKQTALASLSTLGGFATGICTACVAGVFPLIFGLFGISFSFLSLPLKGMEIQLVVIGILMINLYMIKKEKKECETNFESITGEENGQRIRG